MGKNGGRRPGAGRPKGSKNPATIEKEAIMAAFKSRVLEKADFLLNRQFHLAAGISYLYRIERKKNSPPEHVLIEDEAEIKDVLDQLDGMSSGVIDDEYYYVTVKPPDNRAIDSMLDRAFGKAHQTKSIDIRKTKPFDSLDAEDRRIRKNKEAQEKG